MIYDKTQSIDTFLTATAAKQPIPGGGSVAALAGALAAAIGEMVFSYSVGKKDLAGHEPQIHESLAELARARQVMLELMIEDQIGYETLSAIRKLPNDDPERQDKFDVALAVCIRIPQAIGVTATAILRVCDVMVDRVNKYLLSDLAVSAELAMATVRCASYNVRVNLSDVDPNERKQLAMAAEKQVADASKLIRRVIPRIWEKLG